MRDRERSFVHWFTPQRFPTAVAELTWNQGPGAPSGAATWVQGHKDFRQWSSAFPGHKLDQNGASRTGAGTACGSSVYYTVVPAPLFFPFHHCFFLRKIKYFYLKIKHFYLKTKANP